MLAFAMTVNKSQGQTVDHVGIDLRVPSFSHGQLYVGCSRTTTRQGFVMTGSPGDGIGPEAGRLRLSHWAGPSVTGSAKLSQSFYRGIIIMILTKGKPVPLAWEFIYKLGEVTRVTSTILPDMGRECVTEA